MIRFEQAVYGSFPFWDRGYALLAHSPGCRPEWLADFQAACQQFGEPSHGANAAGAMFSLRLPSGPWAIVGVVPQGMDDRGRPGALAFHGLFVTPREFRKVGFDPFALAGALREVWTPETRVLTPGTCPAPTPIPPPPLSPSQRRLLAPLLSGHRVAIASTEPITVDARAVWSHLPERLRRRSSLATLAFGNANRFDLLALPRLAGVELDASYVDPATFSEATRPVPNPEGRGRGRRRLVWMLGAFVVLGLAGVLALRRPRSARSTSTNEARRIAAPEATTSVDAPPARSDFGGEMLTAGQRRLVAEGLVDLADRFDVEAGAAIRSDPTALMLALADQLRYRGPLLTPAERSSLAAEPGGGRALAWDAHIRKFVADRPLPDRFATGPIRWQLATLARSFHVELDGGRSPAEVPDQLADALSVSGPIRPSPLSGRYPTLVDYARFLDRLPTR